MQKYSLTFALDEAYVLCIMLYKTKGSSGCLSCNMRRLGAALRSVGVAAHVRCIAEQARQAIGIAIAVRESGAKNGKPTGLIIRI